MVPAQGFLSPAQLYVKPESTTNEKAFFFFSLHIDKLQIPLSVLFNL